MKKIKTLIFIFLFAFILFSRPATAATPPSFEKNVGNYSIENILNKFNVFSFNDVSGVHIVGPIIAKGNSYNQVSNQGFTFSDYDQGVSSYIQGMIAKGSRTSSSYSKTNPTQYIGTVNTLFKKVYWGDDFVYQVNGADYVNNKVEVNQTDNYVDWDKAKTMLQQQSIQISLAYKRILTLQDIIEKDGISSIRVFAGEQVLLPDDVLTKINRIQLVGEISAKTIVNISSKQPIILPGIITTQTFGEYGKDMNLVINIPYSPQVTLPNAYGNGIGHLVAVNANVIHRSGNYNGGIIAANLDSFSEGHMWFYSANALIDPQVPLTEISGKKIWEDQNDQYGLRPEHVKIELYANDKWVASQIITQKDDWQYSFTQLPVLTNGHYSIREEAVDHYLTSYKDSSIINTLQTAKLIVKKEVLINQINIDSEEIFYTAVFLNNQRISEVQPISTSQNAMFILPYNTYSIYETDQNGHPVDDKFLYQHTPISITFSDTEKESFALLTNSLDTHVRIFKIDQNQQFLKGAHLQLKDENDNIIDEWTSTDDFHEINSTLSPLNTYILHEVHAPTGYQNANDLRFTVEKTADIQSVYLSNLRIEKVEENIPSENSINQTPLTNDNSFSIYMVLLFISGLSIFLSIKKKTS